MEKTIVVQDATGEHKEKPGFGSEVAGRRGSIRKSQVSIRKSPVSIRKSPVSIRAETVSIKTSREHKGRDPQHKKKYHALRERPHHGPQDLAQARWRPPVAIAGARKLAVTGYSFEPPG